MLLLELAVQGVRGFSPAARAALSPGYVVLRSPSEFPSPLAKLLVTLCYSEGRNDDGGLKAPGAAVSRVGLSLQARDDVWRLMRELGGASSLHKQNRQTKQFELLTQDAGEISQVLRTDVGLLEKSTYENLFLFTAAQLPTRRPKEKKAPVGFQSSPSGFRSSPSGFQSSPSGFRSSSSSLFKAPEVGAAENVGETKARIAELEKELEAAKALAETQFKMDGLQGDIFKLETQLKAYEELKARVDAARAEMHSAPTPENLGLPADIIDRVARAGAEKKRRDEQLTRLRADREAAGANDRVVVRSVLADTRFLGGIGAGIGAIALAIMFHEGSGRFLSLLGIPAFTFSALLGLRYVEELQYAAREGAKADVFDQREKKINDEYQMFNSIVELAFEKTNATTAEDFFTAMSRREALGPELQNLELEFADFTRDPEVEQWPHKLQQMRNEFERMNAELGGGAYSRDQREIERDLERQRESLKKAEAPPAPKPEVAAVAAPVQESIDDPMPALMSRGAALFGVDIPTLWSVLHDRTLQYMAALTDRRFSEIDVDADGAAAVESGGRRLTVAEMAGRDVDVLYLSARMTLVEKYSAQQKLPMVLEDAFASVIEPSKQQLFWRMLKHMGTLTQVLHVTGQAQQVTTADVTVAL